MKNEFEYPMWFKGRISGKVIKFDGLCSGTVIVNDRFNKVGDYSTTWCAHTNDIVWEDVTDQYKFEKARPFSVEEIEKAFRDPNDEKTTCVHGVPNYSECYECNKPKMELPKYDCTWFNKLDKRFVYATSNYGGFKNKSDNNGGSTDYYKFKDTWKDCADIMEDRGMNYNQGNIFKSAFCFNIGRHDGTNYERELNKIVYFAQRELARINKETK